MSESMQVWAEIGFNILYLVAIWWLVLRMASQRSDVAKNEQPASDSMLAAFFLLALGDSGHVGFRVLAHFSGDLETTVNLLGFDLGLIGLGVLSTSITVSLFYALFYRAWQLRFGSSSQGLSALVLILLLLRFGLMIPAQNEWNSILSPQPWSTIRNLPLIGMGLLVIVLFFKERQRDRLFGQLAVATLVSFAFYIPVVLWIEQAPLLGMLMIPKTLAYLVMAWLVYRKWFDVGTKEDLSQA
jgi:hypothetical protein